MSSRMIINGAPGLSHPEDSLTACAFQWDRYLAMMPHSLRANQEADSSGNNVMEYHPLSKRTRIVHESRIAMSLDTREHKA